jgi:hypothetical protein
VLYYFDDTILFNISYPNLYSRICIILFSFTRIDSSSSEEDAHAKKKKKVVQEKVNNATDPVADKDANTNLPAKNKAATADNNDEL